MNDDTLSDIDRFMFVLSQGGSCDVTWEPCPNCDGSGEMYFGITCASCDGEAWQIRTEYPSGSVAYYHPRDLRQWLEDGEPS